MQDLNICLIQTGLHWEDRDSNLKMFEEYFEKIIGTPDLIVLPEMFSTGFSMNTEVCAEPDPGPSLEWMRRIARQRNCVVTGSIMTKEGNQRNNRLYWVHPDGKYQAYNKRHLFRFGREHEHYHAGSTRIITRVKGWKFCPLICYDLRFPVWTKNAYENGQYEYDCLLFVANWPERRAHHWKSLLIARAIENMSYCVGVNRVGTDGKDVVYSGHSIMVDPLGNIIRQLKDHEEGIINGVLKAETLNDWREKFRAGQDWDRFKFDGP